MSEFSNSNNHIPSNFSTNTDRGGDDLPLDCFRFVPLLFRDPEQVFAYLWIHSFRRPPVKFIEEFAGLTLKLVEKAFEQKCIAAGYPRSLIQYLFQQLRRTLRKSSVLHRRRRAKLALGAYEFNEICSDSGSEVDLLSWCQRAVSRIGKTREAAKIGDVVLHQFWEQNYDRLVSALKIFVRGHRGIDARDIAHLTSLALYVGHDPSAPLDFQSVRRIALDLYRLEIINRGILEIFDDERSLDLAHDPEAPGKRTPRYVHIAVLATLFDGHCLPQKVLALLHGAAFAKRPSAIVATCSKRTLHDLHSELFDVYQRHSHLSQSVLQGLFTPFAASLDRPFDSFITDKRQRTTYRSALKKIVGSTRLQDYFGRKKALERDAAVAHWSQDVRNYLAERSKTPGTPLNEALIRRFDADPDEDPDKDPEDDPVDEGAGGRPGTRPASTPDE